MSIRFNHNNSFYNIRVRIIQLNLLAFEFCELHIIICRLNYDTSSVLCNFVFYSFLIKLFNAFLT